MTVTAALAEAVPPVPVQLRLYVFEDVSTPVPCEPKVIFVPDQSPLATQDVALTEDQVSVDDPLPDMEAGSALKVTVVDGGVAGGGLDPPPPLSHAARANRIASTQRFLSMMSLLVWIKLNLTNSNCFQSIIFNEFCQPRESIHTTRLFFFLP